MSAFLTDQFWETFLTDDIKTELLSFTDEQLKHLAELGRNEDSILKTPHNRTGADEMTKPLLDEDKLEGNIGMHRSRRGTRLDPLVKHHKNIGFLRKYWTRFHKNHKATKPEFNVGPISARQRNAILMALSGILILSPLINQIKNEKNRQSLTPSDQTIWICTGLEWTK